MEKLAGVLIGIGVLVAVISFFYVNQGNDLINSENETTNGSIQAHNIDIKNFEFMPGTLTVQRGDRVIWTNLDSATHKLNSTEFTSGNLEHDDTYSHVFNSRGTFNYNCLIHTSMKGKIIVE